MDRSSTVRMFAGLLIGWLLIGVSLVLLTLALPATELGGMLGVAQQSLRELWHFVHINLKGSLLPFLAVLLVYLHQFGRLARLLDSGAPPITGVVRREQALDQCASLFFGIGVVWTAIGMRDALLFALGDQDALVTRSAFSVLQRLVDGGILLALSTTIVGATGGYLMRVTKSIVLGGRLAALYMAETGRPGREQLDALLRIERRLSAVHEGDTAADADS